MLELSSTLVPEMNVACQEDRENRILAWVDSVERSTSAWCTAVDDGQDCFAWSYDILTNRLVASCLAYVLDEEEQALEFNDQEEACSESSPVDCEPNDAVAYPKPPEPSADFVQMVRSIGFHTITHQGQRVFRSVKHESYENDPDYLEVRSHEVFISKLPFDLFEDELVPWCNSIGPVAQVRFLVNFSGFTKGMAYVVFSNVNDAFRAVCHLDGKYIRASQVSVKFSSDNRRLLIKNIPDRLCQAPLIKKELAQHFWGIVKVDGEKYEKGGQTCQAVVTFESHQ